MQDGTRYLEENKSAQRCEFVILLMCSIIIYFVYSCRTQPAWIHGPCLADNIFLMSTISPNWSNKYATNWTLCLFLKVFRLVIIISIKSGPKNILLLEPIHIRTQKITSKSLLTIDFNNFVYNAFLHYCMYSIHINNGRYAIDIQQRRVDISGKLSHWEINNLQVY